MMERSHATSAIAVSLFAMTAICGVSSAQSCTPTWDPAIGRPGVTASGYAGPMFVWDDGGGESLYVGGSFDSVGGYVTRGIARYRPGASPVWAAVGGGTYSPNTNYFVAAMNAYDFGQGSELVVGGGFSTAGGTANSGSLARWNGTRWAGMPDAGGVAYQPNGAVWSTAVWNGRLYVGGGFSQVGPLAASGIASYSPAEGWRSLGSGFGGGFAPNVFALKVFNDGTGSKLYAAGRFSSFSGVNGMIARFNGTTWEPVGGGLVAVDSFSDIEAMEIFDDRSGGGPALYVGGAGLRIPSTGATGSVARWDGVSWRIVGQNLGGRTTALAAFDDGNGPALYNGGTAQPGINYFAKLTNNQWVTADGGVGGGNGVAPFPSVFGLLVWRNSLIVAGDFDWAGNSGRAVSGLASRPACARCIADVDNGTGTGTVDGAVTIDDLLYYLVIYGNGTIAADVDNGSGTGTRDNAVTVDDLLYYLVRYDAGC